MRLRNKITNKICDAEAREDGIYVKTNFGDGEKWHKYGLGCLGDNWEYCVDPEKPLIKDKKIRKAVRAWAEANDIIKAFVVMNNNMNWIVYGYDFDRNRFMIEFFYRVVSENDETKNYTIDELCGEEEE